MKWTTKARVQNLIAALPGPLADFCYYRMQRHVGGLRNPTPVKQIDGGCQLAGAIQARRPLDGARVLEVGTGRSLAIPILTWLLGAEPLLTVDLNRYLRPEVLRADLAYLRANQAWLHEQLAPVAGDADLTAGRLADLLALDLQRPPARLLAEVCSSAASTTGRRRTPPRSIWPTAASTSTCRGTCWNTCRRMPLPTYCARPPGS